MGAPRTRPTLVETRLPSEIRIGSRHRKDLGDVVGLSTSIKAYGLIHPIVISPAGELIAGARRLAAWSLAHGRGVPIPVHVFDIEAASVGEYDENVFRKDLTPSELVSLMHELTPRLREIARTRQVELGRGQGARRRGSAVNPFTEGVVGDPDPWEPGETRHKVARLLGTSHVTLSRASQVCDAADENPVRFGPLKASMDRTGRVAGPWKRLVVMRQADTIRAEPPPLPSQGPYRVIVADPPWPFDADHADPTERGTHPYPQMSYGAIEAFGEQVLSIAHADCALWLWTTNHHMPRAYGVLAAWGFAPKTILTWCKDLMGRGHYLREKTEHAIFAVRGRPVISLSAETTELRAPRGGHSEKPSTFYDLVERVCPAPRYACLFSHLQAARPAWDQHTTAGGAETPIAASAEGVA